MLQTFTFKVLKYLDRVKLIKDCLHRIHNRSCYSNVGKRNSWKVVFYGTDYLSEAVLKALHSDSTLSSNRIVKELDIVCIQSDCPVRRYATKNNLTIHTWPHHLPRNIYDVGVVASFGHLIPTECIHACKYGMINAHPSLLPRWRGAAPIIHTILNGDTETGVSIMQVSPNKFDTGKILLQEKYKIPMDCSSKTLTIEMSKMAASMVMKTLKDLLFYIESSYPQSTEGGRYARKVKPENGCIDWEKDSVLTIYRKYKAFNGFIDLYTFWKDMRISILKCAKLEDVEMAKVSSLITQSSVLPGYCFFHKRRKILFVKCQDGWCGITSLKIPKTGKISAQDFYNGFISKERNECYFKKK